MLVNTQDPPDGRNMPQLYKEILREAELAEEFGFDSVFVPEHHMMPDGYLPAPQVLLGAIAARTSHIRLGTSILQLPEWHPINVAEAWAVLDNLIARTDHSRGWAWVWSNRSSNSLAGR